MTSLTYARRTAYKPIDFFFRAVSDIKTKKVEYVDAFQILNDRFLGRMSVCNYFFIAENSVRINELNVIALDELKNYHLVMRENFYVPETLAYSLPITTRFFESDKELNILISTIRENGYKKGDVVFTFDCTTVLNMDDEGKKRYNKLRKMGYKTCMSGFGEIFNSLDIFANFKFDYLRTEAAYFDASESKKKLLSMLLKFCSANKIKLVMEGVDTPPQKNRFKKQGVKLVTGKAVSKLSRYVTNEFLNLPKLTDAQKAAYEENISKALAAAAKKKNAEIEEMRRIAQEAAEAAQKSGKIAPRAPRPELMKSPYQIRLEQQKQAAKKAIEARANKEESKAAVSVEINRGKETQEIKQLKTEMTMLDFEGGVQSMLALSFQQERGLDLKEDAFGASVVIGTESAKGNTETVKSQQTKDLLSNGELRGSETVDAAEGALELQTDLNLGTDTALSENAEPLSGADNRFDLSAQTSTAKSAEDYFAESTGGEVDIINDASDDEGSAEKESVPLEQAALSAEEYFANLGYEIDDAENVMRIIGSDGETYTGHYDAEGKWVDIEGIVYDGYFDVDGNWVSYEEYGAEDEGHYNDEGQWVDAEGNVYDGYFDGDGRWIDYYYATEDGETVSNGYFDNKIKKWIPYGYFNADGEYIKFE